MKRINGNPSTLLTATDPQGIVFDIQRAALHDGPGLRTVVFLKGCPLRCAWCHNPESQSLQIETGRSGKIYGQRMSVDQVMAKVRADLPYFASSGGGLTISGGEPTVQFAFCLALLAAAKAENIETCLDTCGEFPEHYIDQLLPLVDIWHFDFKATSAQAHLHWTGTDGTRIRRNLHRLMEGPARIRLRCPIIPGANDDPQHLEAIEALENTGRFETVERLPYHAIGNPKYLDLGRPVPFHLMS